MPELSPRRRLLVLAICSLSLFIVGLDNTIVNVALPSIANGLHTRISGLQWTLDAFTLVLAGLLISAGSAGDRFGRRKVFQVGLAVFGLSSALCALAPDLGWLIAFRVLQAIGGSMLNPVALSIVTSTFTHPAQRARAVGAWTSVFGVSLALGPVIGGIVVGTVGWRGIFWINVPVVLAAMALTSRFVPESRASRVRRPDPVGQALLIVMLGSLTFAIIQGPGTGWRSAEILGMFGLAAATLALLIAWELRSDEPLIDPRFFRSVRFCGALLSTACTFADLGGFLFLSALYLQWALRLSPLQAGLRLLPAAVAIAAYSQMAAWFAARTGTSRLPLVLGGSALALSTGAMSQLTPASSAAYIAGVFTVFGTGLGMVNAQLTSAIMSAMPPERAGLASGIASTSRQIGQVLGVAVGGSLLMMSANGPVGTAYVHASRVGWWMLAGCGCTVAVFGCFLAAGRAYPATPSLAGSATREHPSHRRSRSSR